MEDFCIFWVPTCLLYIGLLSSGKFGRQRGHSPLRLLFGPPSLNGLIQPTVRSLKMKFRKIFFQT